MKLTHLTPHTTQCPQNNKQKYLNLFLKATNMKNLKNFINWLNLHELGIALLIIGIGIPMGLVFVMIMVKFCALIYKAWPWLNI